MIVMKDKCGGILHVKYAVAQYSCFRSSKGSLSWFWWLSFGSFGHLKYNNETCWRVEKEVKIDSANPKEQETWLHINVCVCVYSCVLINYQIFLIRFYIANRHVCVVYWMTSTTTEETERVVISYAVWVCGRWRFARVVMIDWFRINGSRSEEKTFIVGYNRQVETYLYMLIIYMKKNKKKKKQDIKEL